jgi:hypothetical protein
MLELSQIFNGSETCGADITVSRRYYSILCCAEGDKLIISVKILGLKILPYIDIQRSDNKKTGPFRLSRRKSFDWI